MTGPNAGAFHYLINFIQITKTQYQGVVSCRNVFWTLPGGKMLQKYSQWILLLQRQSRREWCVQSRKAGIFLGVPSPSSYLLKNTKKRTRLQPVHAGGRSPKRQEGWRGQCYSLLSPPGKMERRRTFLFFSSGAIGSGLEAWFSDEESRELLFILKGGAGGFSSISTLSDIFSSTQKFLRDR